ncbi:MAG: CAP domain-containing protein [Myxococcota bacterium]
MTAQGRLPSLLVGLAIVGGCNVISGADSIGFVDDEEDDVNSGFGGGLDGGGTFGPGSDGVGAADGVGGASTGPSGGGEDASGPSTVGGGPTTTTGGSMTTTTTGGGSTTTTTSGGGPTSCGGAGPATTGLDAEEQTFLQLINNYRAQNNLGPLTACVSLNRAAQGHSEDMRDQNYFSHTGLDMSTPWARACDACFDLGCGPSTAMAENIAAGNSGAQATFTQWQNSPGHNANMLNGSFNYIGIGRATGGGQYGVYWTNKFAKDDEPSCY